MQHIATGFYGLPEPCGSAQEFNKYIAIFGYETERKFKISIQFFDPLASSFEIIGIYQAPFTLQIVRAHNTKTSWITPSILKNVNQNALRFSLS